MTALRTDADKMKYAARSLAHDGIWVKHIYWTDEDGREVEKGDPEARKREATYEVDYDRLVALVVGYLSDDTAPTHIESATVETYSPVPSIDWIFDPNLSRDEKLARFEALHPQPTHGPDGQS